MPIDETHTAMNTPKSDYRIWRYMDIPSFLSILVENALTFTSARLMEDKFEGTLPKLTKILDELFIKKITIDYKIKNELTPFSEIMLMLKDSVYLNCWCKEKTEMVHMWKIYSKENGIAIETTYSRLKEAIIDEETIYPTEISYLDYEKQYLDCKSNTLTPYTIKRLEYKSEQELRLIISFPNKVKNTTEASKTITEMNDYYKKFPVIKIKVNVFKLIEAIHVSPFAPIWYTDLVRKTLDKFGLGNISVIRSEL